MQFRIRDIETEDKVCRQVQLSTFQAVLTNAMIDDVLARTGRVTQRERKLNLRLMVWVMVGLGWFADCSIPRVLGRLIQGTSLWLGRDKAQAAGGGALTYRRQQLGVRPLALLCRQICQPLATAQTPGAFAFGRRLVALDGTVDAVPDTPENVAVFGRAAGRRGPSAWAQVRGVHLVECGTHAVLGSTFWPYHVSERRGAWRLLAQIQPAWLVMWDCGFHAYEWLAAVQARGADFLARCPATVKPQVVRTLADGTRLVYLRPSNARQRRTCPPLLVRWIEYRLTDPAWADNGKVFRLVTSLLDPAQYPVRELLRTYHLRWEFEVSLDEIETHQRLSAAVLRSRQPAGVMQELYGLVLSHYLIRAVMSAAADTGAASPIQLSFVAALELVRQSLVEFQVVAPTHWPDLFQRLLRDIGAAQLPPRRNRVINRVVRRPLSKFQRKRSQKRQPVQPQASWLDAFVLI
jgi:hypothetical protein